MEELRTQIWDLLFRAKASKSIQEIGQLLNQELETIRVAVDHEWFLIDNDLVSISCKE